MTITPQKYRLKHRRCRYCKYIGHIGYGDNRIYNWCKVKDRHKREWILLIFLNYLQGCFCKCYKAKEIDFDI